MRFRYQAYGLQLASDRELPELLPSTLDVPPDIEIRQADLPRAVPDPRYADDTQQITPGVYQFSIREVAWYRVEEGQRILVDPHPDADPGDVRLWILGTALGALLHQRGALPLHASALNWNGQAIAFCGDSGAGKSTLAAAFHRRGLPVLTDDVGLVVPEPDRVMFHAGVPRIKLWRDALTHFEWNPDTLIRDLTRADKFHLTLGDRFNAQSHPLQRIYVLEPSPDDRARFEPILGHAAIGVIRDHTYRPELIHALGQSAHHLRLCGGIARQVKVYRFCRPWQLDRLEESLNDLLLHLHEREDE